MKKLVALLLALVLSCLLLTACGGGGAPAELTKETIVGKWESDMGATLGGAGKVTATIEFTADGKYITTLNDGEYRQYLKDMYEGLNLPGNMDINEMIDMAIEAFNESSISTYSFDGEKFVLGGAEVDFEYKDGVITVTQLGVSWTMTYLG